MTATEEHDFVKDLRKLIEKKQAVIVVGSGVSMSTCSQAPTWRSLIESGVAWCRKLGVEEEWCELIMTQLKMHARPGTLLSAAEQVQEELSLNGGGEFTRWLRDTFENLKPEDSSVIEALASLDVPLITTNYDDLIEKATGLKHVTWRDQRNVSRLVHGGDRRVLHVHGYWDEPESVVLGIRSYEAVKNSDHTQAVLKALGMTKSLVFIGCGEEGLADPNWGNFLTWLKSIETTVGVEHRHYRLVRKQDVFQPDGRLYPLVYGEDYADLQGFLERLRPKRADIPKAGSGKASGYKRASLPESIHAYLERLAEDTANLTLMGMGRSLQIELPIVEAYVPLRTTLARSGIRATDRYKQNHAEYEEDLELGEVFHRVEALGQRGVVLLGEPGAGKTTGARQLAWRLACKQCLSEDLGLPPGMTPVLLRFRDLTRRAWEAKNGLQIFLEEETYCAEAHEDKQSPGPDLWNGRGGALLWILDGLDEVADPEARQTVSEWVRRALKNRPQDWFLVTCRFQGYFREGVPLGPKFVEFHVRPLNETQVERFVQDWFAAAY